LIVDDNRDGADSLALMLRLMGNDTVTAYDGQEGVDTAERVRPDVILLDIGLPKLNGYEAARRIREQSWGNHPVLIAVTGWGQDEDRRRSHDAGFDHHMVKPVDPDNLLKLLAGLQASKG
jgi:CheY-like chemotaxis protein